MVEPINPVEAGEQDPPVAAEPQEPGEGQLEARMALRRKFPRTPSAEEVRAHRASHMPFRDWCPECVAGAANARPIFMEQKKIRTKKTNGKKRSQNKTYFKNVF